LRARLRAGGGSHSGNRPRLPTYVERLRRLSCLKAARPRFLLAGTRMEPRLVEKLPIRTASGLSRAVSLRAGRFAGGVNSWVCGACGARFVGTATNTKACSWGIASSGVVSAAGCVSVQSAGQGGSATCRRESDRRPDGLRPVNANTRESVSGSRCLHLTYSVGRAAPSFPQSPKGGRLVEPAYPRPRRTRVASVSEAYLLKPIRFPRTVPSGRSAADIGVCFGCIA
jgi:hypothetical protein